DRPGRPRASRLHRARHPRGLGLRVRVPDGADEPQAPVDGRDGVPHAAREVHVHLLAPHQGSRRLRHVGDGDGPDDRREAAGGKVPSQVTRRAAAEGATRRAGRTPEDACPVVVSCGAKHALVNIAVAVLNPGDEVLIPNPYWVSYPEQARLVGGVPVEVETREATGFDLDPDRLRAAVGPRTKVIILNSPNNP